MALDALLMAFLKCVDRLVLHVFIDDQLTGSIRHETNCL